MFAINMNDKPNHIAIAAVIHDGKHQTDETILRFVARLRQQGLRVHGTVQAPQTYSSAGSRQMGIIDLTDGSNLTISQDRGSGARGCCVDPGALADASLILRRACDANADLAVVNRYGKLEAEGDGFATDMLALMMAGIPMITVVKPKHLDAWRNFTGGMATELPADEALLLAWYCGVRP